jgi:hypothetical protein
VPCETWRDPLINNAGDVINDMGSSVACCAAGDAPAASEAATIRGSNNLI